MKCTKCGFVSDDDQDFIVDYYFDEEIDDEIPAYQCPKCGNDDDELMEDIGDS